MEFLEGWGPNPINKQVSMVWHNIAYIKLCIYVISKSALDGPGRTIVDSARWLGTQIRQVSMVCMVCIMEALHIELASCPLFLAGSEHADCLHRTMYICHIKVGT